MRLHGNRYRDDWQKVYTITNDVNINSRRSAVGTGDERSFRSHLSIGFVPVRRFYGEGARNIYECRTSFRRWRRPLRRLSRGFIRWRGCRTVYTAVKRRQSSGVDRG